MEKRVITTERLEISPCKADDCYDVYEYCKNPNIGPIAGWAPHKSPEESREIIEEIFIPHGWSIRERGKDKVIGLIGIHPDRLRQDANSMEIGYSLSEEFWGRGFMTEAAKAMISYCFEVIKLSQVAISTSKVNKRSQGVIENCGFTYEGTIRRTYKVYDGSLRDSMIFSMTREEYDRHKAEGLL